MFADTSSSDDEFEKIKEAVDESFLSKDLYTESKLSNVGEKCKSSPKQLPSLRNQNQQEVDNNPFSIKVTPEFQKHVSKHLSKLLDKLIDDSEIVQKSKKLKKSNRSNGVRLLSTSKEYLTPIVNNKPIVTVSKFNRGKNFIEIDFEERAKEVAVSPEWVLSQEETKCWAPDTKGKIEIIKLDNYKHKKKKLR